MKVFLHYEDNEDKSLHKSLKITLPKSWKNGPTDKLLKQFVESYNASEQGEKLSLNESELHLAIREPASNDTNNTAATTSVEYTYNALASDAITVDVIEDRQDVYIINGKSQTLAEINAIETEKIQQQKLLQQNTVACVHFGCKNRFPKGGPYPTNCIYHASPPVFHETAKFWSCCPHKKAYDWDDFQNIPGCQTGICTDVKLDNNQHKSQFLGGCDLREQAAGAGAIKLKSIDDFNASQAAGGSQAAPVLDRLRSVLEEIGVEKELFDQVLDGIQSDLRASSSNTTSSYSENDNDLLNESTMLLGKHFKDKLKSLAVDRLRIS